MTLLHRRNSCLFLWQVQVGALQNEQALIDHGALHQKSVIVQGEWWRLLSSVFLHGGVAHLVGNVIALYILGIGCDHAYGALRTAGIFFVSGLIGSIFTVAVEPRPTVGASGAIFGIMGCLVVMFLRYRNQLFLRDHRIGYVIAAWAAWQVLTGFLNPNIANFAHLGGFAGGALLGILIAPPLLHARQRDATDA
jgi:rhomboid protease GluP